MRAAAAACLAAGALATALPPPAAAYPCGEVAPSAAEGQQLTSAAADDCRLPETGHMSKPPARTRKKGSISGLTVFVLAIAAALLVPIGRNDRLHRGDPFGHDPTRERRL